MKLFNPVFNFQYLTSHKFCTQSKEIQGDNCYLINPSNIVYKDSWEKQDLIFRSSIWNDQGMPVSLSFKKFFNWGEAPTLVPPPTSVIGINVMEKLDGSTLIVSKYKGQFILRTRGSFDCSSHENADELKVFLDKYPQVQRLENGDTWFSSYIFEWYSPANKIVINYGNDPIFWLTNIIDHEDYSYWKQDELDAWAEWHGLKRPRWFKVKSIEDILNLTPVKDDMFEGFCIYFNDDQDILKVKTPKYLAIHAFKSSLSLDKIVDLFILYNKPSYEDFIKLITAHFDFECANYAMPVAIKICEAAKEVNKITNKIKELIEELWGEDRKFSAESIIGTYGNTIKSGIAFSLLSKKDISNKQYRKLLEEVLRG